MLTKIRALKDCAVVAGKDVHQLKKGDIAGIDMNETELFFSVDHQDVEVIKAQEAPKVEAKVETPEPVVKPVAKVSKREAKPAKKAEEDVE